jgi:hypothetical protein
MKNLTSIVLLFCSLFLFSCVDEGGSGAAGNSAEETVKLFMDKIKAKDFEGAKKFTTAATDPLMDFLVIRIKMLEEMGKKEEVAALFDNIDLAKATAKCQEQGEEQGNNGTCQICEEGKEKCKDIAVVKEGGKWRVHIPKESNAVTK